MTRKKRYLFSYLLLALALVVLFAANLFWGRVALTPGAVLAALTGRVHSFPTYAAEDSVMTLSKSSS